MYSEKVCVLPDISIQSVADALGKLYNLRGDIVQLDGERDLNFRISVGQPDAIVSYVFKVSNALESRAMLACQHEVLLRINDVRDIECSQLVPSVNGQIIETIAGDDNTEYLCRLCSWMEGSLLSTINPLTSELLQSLGAAVGRIDCALKGYQNSALDRPLLWKMDLALQVTSQYKPLLATAQQRELIERFQSLFQQKVLGRSARLRTGVIHNDANDNNIIVDNLGPFQQKVTGLIDFGDMVHSWVVADLAVACAYAMLDQAKPLDVAADIIRGYHDHYPLEPDEVDALFSMIAMRLCMSVCICAYQKSMAPDNQYLVVSEQPAWRMLETLAAVPVDFACYVFRDACGLVAVPQSDAVTDWLGNRKPFSSIVDLDLSKNPLLILDTSVSSPHINSGNDEHQPETMSRALFRAIEDNGAVAGIGRYDEYRLIYNSDDFVDFSGNQRTLHLGIDIFQVAGSPVFAPLDGVVFSLANNDAPLDYGGTIILRHQAEIKDDSIVTFYTLFGHLSPDSFSHLQQGQSVAAGDLLGKMGEIHENGQWPPHVHFEIITDLLDETETFVGVGSHQHRNVWLGLCPDPNIILGIPEEMIQLRCSDQQRDSDPIRNQREQHLSAALSLSYREPIVAARGVGQYLYDATGRRYLDAVNNVPHVGHCHPHVVQAGAQAASVLSTNTRYLYPQIGEYVERLLSTFAPELSVAFLVNSGSEANDLALRLSWAYSGNKDVLVLDHAYHGNLTALIDMSPYKHDGPGGKGTPGWVHKVEMPDTFRGPYPADDPACVSYYAAAVDRALTAADKQGGTAAFICESILGCGGQVILPQGYLSAVYSRVRAVGGICIADEVQTGFGRTGSHFWAFQAQDVTPDIVTLGKPAGNGHPLGVVVTTKPVAESFVNGMEYFNTFGGNPVSCAIGSAVLDVIAAEGLQQNALNTGNYLMRRLSELKQDHPVIGEVRGAGLFIGVDLVDQIYGCDPAASQAAYIAERMKQEGVLISTDGPHHNVLKIKPPMVFNRENADYLVQTLGRVLEENWAIPASC